jgi:hypothetical protein
MTTFLRKTAHEILKDNHIPLEEKIIVLPNKRAGIFLSKALVDISGKPIISPEIITIQDFVSKYSPWEKMDWLELVFTFYQAYTHYYQSINKPKQIKDFDEFIKWAPIVLNDFEELDRFLLDPKKVFHYISEAKVLEKWNLENANSKFIHDFKDYFSSLYGLYKSLRNKLIEKKQAYTGMNYRYLAENITEIINKFSQNQIYFAGFNALTKAEEIIIDGLVSNNKAKIFWDTDDYYLQKNFEAGKFLRNYKKKSSEFNWTFNNYREEKNIEIINADGQMAQMKILSDILKKNQYSIDQTAVILNENTLLFPLLDSLPENIKSLNITLGIPVSDIPLIQIFNQINQLFIDIELYGKYKVEHILELLHSPIFSNQLNEISPKQKDYIIDQTVKYGSILIDEKFIKNLTADLSGIFKLIFDTPHTVPGLIHLYINIIDQLQNKDLELTEKIALQKLEEVISQIKEFQDTTQTISSIKTLDLIFKKLLSKEQIYFEGEPLEGLQILGLLETRLLDFDHIIMTSVNEGIIPKGKNDQSIIPFDIKLELGLPTHRDQTSIMAYYFYRILQRAKKISLIYNSNESGFVSGELSRFALQLKNELPSYNSKVNINEISYKTHSKVLDLKEEIEKTPYIMKKLRERASREKGLGPTSLTRYIYDPISFIKQNILKLEEEEEIIEGVSPRIMGIVIHNTLEKLYTPYIGKIITKQDLKNIKGKYKKIALDYFNKEISGSGQLHGQKHIAFEVIQKNINDIINIDNKLVNEGKEIEIIGLEKKFKSSLQIKNGKIYIVGLVDRIDKVDGKLRIVDYKTGNVKAQDLSVSDKLYKGDFHFLLKEEKYDKLFQLLTYAWLFQKQNPDKHSHFTAGIISSRKYRAGLHEIKINGMNQIPFETLKEFEKSLLLLLEEIFDPSLPFKQK